MQSACLPDFGAVRGAALGSNCRLAAGDGGDGVAGGVFGFEMLVALLASQNRGLLGCS